MSRQRLYSPQFDLFIPYVADVPLRDQRETMERPFFSLSKNKRIKPIDYVSPDGSVYVRVTANAELGMATIWDADILIWAASHINDMRNRGINHIPRSLAVHPYDLLRTIHRDTGGREYALLRQALRRLQATTVFTNIRAERTRKKERQFSWIESYDDLSDAESGKPLGMRIVLSDWFYEGVMSSGGLLAIDPAYFAIAGGRERWLYRVARKHAGGTGEEGFAIALDTLFQKSGAEGTYRRFKFEIARIVRDNALPGFLLRLEERAGGESLLRMVSREFPSETTDAALAAHAGKGAARPPRTPSRAPADPSALPLFKASPRPLSDDILARIRQECPGWDVYAMQREFDTWLGADASRTPRDYEAAFLGFLRRHHAAQRRG
jgi:plasmid replication initiation protein